MTLYRECLDPHEARRWEWAEEAWRNMHISPEAFSAWADKYDLVRGVLLWFRG